MTAAARAPASLMLAESAGMQGSQRASLEQYWLGRHVGRGRGQVHSGTVSAEEEGMHAAPQKEQSCAEAWGDAARLPEKYLEPAGGRGWQDDAGDARQSVLLQRREHISAGQGPICLMVFCACNKLMQSMRGFCTVA